MNLNHTPDPLLKAYEYVDALEKCITAAQIGTSPGRHVPHQITSASKAIETAENTGKDVSGLRDRFNAAFKNAYYKHAAESLELLTEAITQPNTCRVIFSSNLFTDTVASIQEAEKQGVDVTALKKAIDELRKLPRFNSL